jgi:hypothetical protein
MTNQCEDCGCGTLNGICSNCQEELFIMCNQSEDQEEPFSEEFREKADSQIKTTH